MANCSTLIHDFQSGAYDNKLSDLYFSDDSQITYQRNRYAQALKQYMQLFGNEDVQIYSAPGRTEIGGNHTDHQNGMVLAASIHPDAIAIAGHNDAPSIQVISEGYAPITVPLDNIDADESEAGTTASLIKGMVAGFQNRGYKAGPFKAYVTSDVLGGAGLSSSAAFEVLIGTILSGMYNQLKISSVEIAMIGQYAENVYFGKPCGLMDQMACSVGSLVHIDFLHPEQPVVNKITYDIQKKGYSLCIVDTKGSHADLTPDYAAVPTEMKAVAGYFGKEVLTQVSEEDFYAQLPQIRKVTGDRAVLRAIHFFNENKRVQLQVNALHADDFDTFLQIFGKSADSSYRYLQNAYSCHDDKNQAIPVALALSERILGKNGVCRVHGGGFAGTIQVFAKSEFVSCYKQEIEKYMGEGTCHILQIRKYGGVRVV